MISVFVLLGLIVCDITVVVCQSSTSTQDLSMSRVNAAAATLSNHNIAESSIYSTSGMEVSLSSSKSNAEMSPTFFRLSPSTSMNVASGDTNQTFPSSAVQTSKGLYRDTANPSMIAHSKSLKMNSDEPGSVNLLSSAMTRTIKPSKTIIRDSVNGSRTIATVSIDSTVLSIFVKSSDPKIAIEDSFTSRDSSSSHYTSIPVSNINLSSTSSLLTSYMDTTSLRNSISAIFPTFTTSDSMTALSKFSSINSITQLSPAGVVVSNTAETRFIAPTKTTQINYSTIVDSSFGATSTRYFSETKHSIHLTTVPLDNLTTVNGSGYSTLNSPSSIYSEKSQYMTTTTTSIGKSSMTSNMPESTTKLSSSLELSSVPSTISFSEHMSAENLIKHSVTDLNSQTLTTNFSAHLQSNPILSDTFETLSTILHGISFSDNAFKSSTDGFIGKKTSSHTMSTPTITVYYSDSARGHHKDSSKFVATMITDKSHSFSSIVNSRILQTNTAAKTYSEENKSYDFTTSSTWKMDIKDTLSASDETKTYDALASEIIDSAADIQHSTSEIKLSIQRSIIYTTSSKMQLSYSTLIKTKLTENNYQTRQESTINDALLESINIKTSTEGELLSTTATSSLLMISVPSPMLTYGTTNPVVTARTVGGSSFGDPSFAVHDISTPPSEKSTIWNHTRSSESRMSTSYDQSLFTRTSGSLDSSEINNSLLESINITSSTESLRLSIATTPSSPMTSVQTTTLIYGTTNSVATARSVVGSSSGDPPLSIHDISTLLSERLTIWNHAKSAESGMSTSYDQSRLTSTAIGSLDSSEINNSLIGTINITSSSDSQLLSIAATPSSPITSVQTTTLIYGTTNSVATARSVVGSSSGDPPLSIHDISTLLSERSTIWNHAKSAESGMSTSYDQSRLTSTAIGSLDSSEINNSLIGTINITSSSDSQLLSIAATPSSPMTSVQTSTAMYGTTNSVATERPVVESLSGSISYSIHMSIPSSGSSAIWNHSKTSEAGMLSSYDQSLSARTVIGSLDSSEMFATSPFFLSLIESTHLFSMSQISSTVTNYLPITTLKSKTIYMFSSTVSFNEMSSPSIVTHLKSGATARSVGGSSSEDPSFAIHDILTQPSEISTIWSHTTNSESVVSLFTSTAIGSLDSSEINKPLLESINITSSTDSQLLSIIATPSSPMTSVKTPPLMFGTTNSVATARLVVESASGDTSFSIHDMSIPLSKSSPILNHTKSPEASMSSSYDQSLFTNTYIGSLYSSEMKNPLLESINITASTDSQLLSITVTPSPLRTSVKTPTLMYGATNSAATARSVVGSSSGDPSFPINDTSTPPREISTIWKHAKSPESGMSSSYDQSLFTSTSLNSLYSSEINNPLLESINITASTDSQLLSITAMPSSPMTSVKTPTAMYGMTNYVATARSVVGSSSGDSSFPINDMSIPSSGSSAIWKHTKTSEAGISSSYDQSLSTRTDIGSLDSSEMFATSPFFPSFIESTHLVSMLQISSTVTKYFPIPTFKSNSFYMFSSTVSFNEMSSLSILTHLMSLETGYSSYIFESIPAYSIRSSYDSILTISVSSSGSILSELSPSTDFSASHTYITNVVLHRSTPYNIHSSESHVANENLNDTYYNSISPSSVFNISSIPSASESGSQFNGNVSTPILLASSFESKSDFLQASSSDISKRFLNVNVSQVQTNTMLITTAVQTSPVEFSTSLTSPLVSLPTNIVVTGDAIEVLLSTRINNPSYKTNDIDLSTTVISFGLSTWTSTFISSESTIASDSSSSVMTTGAVIQPSFTPVFSQSIVYNSTDSENVNHSTKYWNVYSNMSSTYRYTSTTPGNTLVLSTFDGSSEYSYFSSVVRPHQSSIITKFENTASLKYTTSISLHTFATNDVYKSSSSTVELRITHSAPVNTVGTLEFFSKSSETEILKSKSTVIVTSSQHSLSPILSTIPSDEFTDSFNLPASSPDVNTDSLPITDMLTSNIVFTSSPIDISSTRVSSASLFSWISKSSGNLAKTSHSVLETSHTLFTNEVSSTLYGHTSSILRLDSTITSLVTTNGFLLSRTSLLTSFVNSVSDTSFTKPLTSVSSFKHSATDISVTSKVTSTVSFRNSKSDTFKSNRLTPISSFKHTTAFMSKLSSEQSSSLAHSSESTTSFLQVSSGLLDTSNSNRLMSSSESTPAFMSVLSSELSSSLTKPSESKVTFLQASSISRDTSNANRLTSSFESTPAFMSILSSELSSSLAQSSESEVTLLQASSISRDTSNENRLTSSFESSAAFMSTVNSDYSFSLSQRSESTVKFLQASSNVRTHSFSSALTNLFTQTSQISSSTTLLKSTIVSTAFTQSATLSLQGPTSVSFAISPTPASSVVESWSDSLNTIELYTVSSPDSPISTIYGSMSSNVEPSFSTTSVTNSSVVIISSTTDAVNVTFNTTDLSTFVATYKLTPASTSNLLMSTQFKNISATKTSSEIMYSSHAVSTPEPTRTTENATTAREKNWVKTVLKVQKNINVSDPTFRMKTEQGLAKAYSEAFLREKLIAEGQFDPLEDRKRRKRYTTVGEAAVHVHELLRTAGSSEVTAVYTVERQGRVLDAEEAVAALVTLDTQELAIILRQVVAVKAETYIPTTTQTTPTSDESQIWLIAAIAGGAGGALLIVFIAICIYCKCCRHKPVGNDDGDPELMSIEEPAPRKRSLPPSPSKRPLPRQRSSISAIIPTKLRSYAPENPELSESGHGRDEGEHLLHPPPIKHSTPSKGRLYAPVEKSCTPPPSARDLAPPAQRSRRESRNSISPATEFMELATSSMHSEGLQPDRADMFQTSFTEDNEHVKQHLHEEKEKNKVKLRGKYADMNGDVTAMNETILGMQNTSVPHLVIESGRLVPDNTTEQEQPPDNGKSGDENIAEARKRMHRLLDDAFSLISPGNSFSEQDLRIQQQNKTDENKEKEKQASNTSPVQPELINALVSSQSDVPTAKPSGKGYTNPAYKALYGDYLETWSPYRAYDQVALISMPNKMDIPVTKLGQKSNNNVKGRRPATDLNVLDVQDVTTDGSTYTKDPGKPILLRTKEERPSSGKPPQLTNNYVDERPSKFSFNGSVPQSRSSSGVNTGLRNASKDHHVVKSETKTKENRRESDLLQQHRRPERNLANKDIVDIVSDIHSKEKNERLIKSIRDELTSSKVEKEEDINKKPIKRRSRKVKKPMTDSV